jgi:outer membrane protein OmpA-like peptidoglycan-associated protein
MSHKYLLAAAVALALGACASAPPPNAALETARAQVNAAQTDPNVAQYDPLDLQAARQDLAAAEQANAHRDEPQTNQMAYIAAQTARLAQERAAAKAEDARIAQGTAERDRIQAQARSREANAALAQRNAALEQANAATLQSAQLQAQSAQLQAEVDALKAKQTDRGIVLTLGDVLFDTGRATLNPGAAMKLDRLAAFLNEHPDRRVQIEGFTDSVGSDAYNQDLSERRAEAVKAALTMRGIDSSRIATEGYGKAYPVASNSDSGGRQLNRRVEVVIGNANTPIAPRSAGAYPGS